MTNRVPCPECETVIDAVEASLVGWCPECDTPFTNLLDEPENDPEDAGPYSQYEDTML